MAESINVILSPHVDDEVIGCFSLLNDNKIDYVYYFFELDEIRKKEAIESGKRFSFIPIFTNIERIHLLELEGCNIYLPTSHDNHIHHKLLSRSARNQFFNSANLFYYSVDMKNAVPIKKELQQRKMKYLKNLFPSQHLLLEDEKYWLFEEIKTDDFNTKKTFNYKIKTIEVRITVDDLKLLKSDIFDIIGKIEFMRVDTGTMDRIANFIQIKYNTTVSVELKNDEFSISGEYL